MMKLLMDALFAEGSAAVLIGPATVKKANELSGHLNVSREMALGILVRTTFMAEMLPNKTLPPQFPGDEALRFRLPKEKRQVAIKVRAAMVRDSDREAKALGEDVNEALGKAVFLLLRN